MGFGQKGIRAERVASGIVGQARPYLNSGAAVGPLLADQLLIPLVLTGKRKNLTCKPTEHTLINREAIALFTEKQISVSQLGEDVWEARVYSGAAPRQIAINKQYAPQ